MTHIAAKSTAAKPIAVKLEQDIRDRIKRLAEVRQRSTHWLMREAIQQYVEREERCEAFRQDGIQAWEAYRRTGLHVTLEEADAWLITLEDGHDVEPPECHV
ncbi:ribbon-helix-helix protein, CopG family [uncultured Thiocystis sp.]|uniref:CopG family ribbon-helix-helix protein n=1 Tax=uncultured Thiocystis sp. TaxID=1202134 RepID=UPI0025E292B0|nr:ribbon-helix-helix protein, CopG family [uncultured Thiocystis sp.]